MTTDRIEGKKEEIRRLWRMRHGTSYWAVNARVWIKRRIHEIRTQKEYWEC